MKRNTDIEESTTIDAPHAALKRIVSAYEQKVELWRMGSRLPQTIIIESIKTQEGMIKTTVYDPSRDAFEFPSDAAMQVADSRSYRRAFVRSSSHAALRLVVGAVVDVWTTTGFGQVVVTIDRRPRMAVVISHVLP